MTTITVAEACKSQHFILYSTHRGNRVVDIKLSKGWYVISFASGGKRHVRGDHLLRCEDRRESDAITTR